MSLHLPAALCLAGGLVLSSTIASVSGATSERTTMSTCRSITKSLVVGDGFKSATGPTVTPYNYTKLSANAKNALGTTIDFGSKALVVGCVSPSDISKLSVIAQGKKKPTMTANQYMAYMVAQSQGAMKKTMVGGVADYLDFGNSKEDGLGSAGKAGSVRLDAWVEGSYIFLTFIAPAVSPAPKSLVNFIGSTHHLFA